MWCWKNQLRCSAEKSKPRYLLYLLFAGVDTVPILVWRVGGNLYAPLSAVYLLYIRPRRMHCVDAACSVVWVYVYLCVGHTSELCKNGRTDRDAVWGLTRVGPRNRVLAGARNSHRKRQFGGFQAHWNALGVSAAVYVANWIIEFSLPAAMLPTGRYHITLSN